MENLFHLFIYLPVYFFSSVSDQRNLSCVGFGNNIASADNTDTLSFRFDDKKCKIVTMFLVTSPS